MRTATRLAFAHARAMTVELVRHPAYIVPTLAFPTLFFLFFASNDMNANLRMAGFAGFAAIGVAFFQFGVGIAVERASPWEQYLRTLPVGAVTRLAARVLSAAIFAAAAAGLLVVVAVVTTPVSLEPARWIEFGVVLMVCTVPFALLGIALGYIAPARGALPIANVLYLGLSYAGGLWLRPQRLPTFVERVSRYLPTRALRDVLGAPALGVAIPWRSALALVAFSLFFALSAVIGYRHDEGRRFR